MNWYCTSVVKAGNPQPGEEVERVVPGLLHFIRNPYLAYTHWGWSYDPLGFRYALRVCWDRFHMPIMITENGWSEIETLENGTVHDAQRIKYLHDHIEQIRDAIDDGVHVIGYHTWSFMDVLSSADGFNKRYGLIYVDRDEFDAKECKRYKKDSFYYYKHVIASNGNDLSIPQK